MSQNIVDRRTTRCCECKDTFSYIIRVSPEQLAQQPLLVELSCPYCKSKLSIDLSPWKRRNITGHKGLGDDSAESGELTLELPEELPTQLREK